MKICIEPKVFSELGEGFAVGVVACSGVKNTKSSPELVEMLRDVEELIRVNFTPESLGAHPLVSAWKAAAAHYGPEFEHHQSKVEKLMKSVLEGHSLKSSTMLADLCTFISLKHLLPVGIVDTARLTGKLSFGIARGGEIFDSGKTKTKPARGELILRDSIDILSRKLDYDVSPKAEPKLSTKNAVVHTELVPPMATEKLGQVLEELATLIKIFCGGKVRRMVIGKGKDSAEV